MLYPELMWNSLPAPVSVCYMLSVTNMLQQNVDLDEVLLECCELCLVLLTLMKQSACLSTASVVIKATVTKM